MEQDEKVVTYIPPTIVEPRKGEDGYRQKRVVAYCRVSTNDKEQLTSYEAQLAYYSDYIRKNPDWHYAGIYADKGITGTSVKRRDEFKKMIRQCKRGRVDMIITKSISRFARNTMDCLKYTRELKAIGVDVYFEEQRLHSTQSDADFYITLYGSIAQTESENISENVKWGKEQAAKEGKAAFFYSRFLGYMKGEDGKPVINEEEAPTIRFIFNRLLAGDSETMIANKLKIRGDKTPSGKGEWSVGTVHSILTNVRYMGDVIINKTYTVDCLSKKVKVNNGERGKYYIKNNHPAIIDRETFLRVQEELARRAAKKKVKQVGTKTEQGKYSGKYALTELLVCGECKTPYRRCTWTSHGYKRIVWRCINRLDYGTKYCHESPTMEENVLHSAIVEAIQEMANESGTVLDTLKLHIGMGIKGEESLDEEMAIKIRLAEIQVEIKEIIKATSADTVDFLDEKKIQNLAIEQAELQGKLELLQGKQEEREKNVSRMQDICTILDGLKNHPLIYDDELIRKLIETIVVLAKDKIRIVFKGGVEKDQIIIQ